MSPEHRDAVTREQIEAWAKLAGIEHFTEKGLERLGDFAIFARQARAASTATDCGQTEREAFEAWALTDEGNCSEKDLQHSIRSDEYVNPLVERDWMVWQARAAAPQHTHPLAEGDKQ